MEVTTLTRTGSENFVDKPHSSAVAPSNTGPGSDTGNPRRWAIMWVLGAVAFMAQLDFWIVNVALDGIGESFPGSSESGLSWVLNAYAIIFAAVLVLAGRVADLWGRKRILLLGVAIFTAASALASFAPTLEILVAARAIQAVGGAMIVPTSLGLLYPSFPKRQHTFVVGLWAGVAAVAASAGPPVGGLLVSVDWRLIFLINLPIGIAAILAGLKIIPEVREGKGARMPDTTSVVAVLAAVSLTVLATVQGPEWGWGDWRVIALFVVAAIAIAVTVQRTLTTQTAIIEKDLFRSREFTKATIALFLFFTGFSIFLLGSALFMQNVWHFTSLAAGVGLAPAPIVAIGFAVSAGPIQRRFGRTTPILTGTIAMAVAASLWIVFVRETPDYWGAMFPALIVMGISGGLSQAPMFAAAGSLPANRATTGSAVLNMSRQVGSAVGVALLIALTAMNNQVTGFNVAWWVQVGAALAAAATTLLLRNRKS
jgi:EmrB/QacA subfamily drug resistance transporter